MSNTSHCLTAQTLKKINYPGEWFIVCGNNDETLPEYQQNWGDKVLVFDWYEQIKTTDTLDNFGFEKKASGACPVRNAVRAISEARGEKRHWQMDDDYTGFHRYDGSTGKNKTIKDGKILFSSMYRIAKFALDANLGKTGFILTTIEAAPQSRKTFNPHVANAMNMPSDPVHFIPWTGRMNDDVIHCVNNWKNMEYEIQFKYLQLASKPTRTETGGLTEMYKNDGAARRTAYFVMVAPCYVKMTQKKGEIMYKMDWRGMIPKLIRESYRKV